MKTITVCIASVGRSSLKETLHSVCLCASPKFLLKIIVADDSNTDSVKNLVANEDWSESITVLHAGQKNISVARNICLDASTGDYVAFIDDDEVAHCNWLIDYFMLAEESGADAVFGPVNALYPESAALWMRKAGPFIKRPGLHESTVLTGSTSNAFVRLESIKRIRLRFLEEFGRSGGEDTDFFFRLRNSGALLLASENSVVSEVVPIHRLNIADLRRRYTRGGQTYAKIMLDSASLYSKSIFYLGAHIKLVASIFIVVLTFLFRKDLAMKFAFKAWLNIGKIRNLIGLPLYQIY